MRSHVPSSCPSKRWQSGWCGPRTRSKQPASHSECRRPTCSAIASLHAEVPCDWAQIAALYGRLARLTGSPVVELNRAIAIAEIEGPEAGLRIIDQLSPRLGDFRYLHSTKAELSRRLGRIDEAREAFLRAKFLTHDVTGRRFLERRLSELDFR